jgi:hypothetical protein
MGSPPAAAGFLQPQCVLIRPTPSPPHCRAARTPCVARSACYTALLTLSPLSPTGSGLHMIRRWGAVACYPVRRSPRRTPRQPPTTPEHDHSVVALRWRLPSPHLILFIMQLPDREVFSCIQRLLSDTRPSASRRPELVPGGRRNILQHKSSNTVSEVFAVRTFFL